MSKSEEIVNEVPVKSESPFTLTGPVIDEATGEKSFSAGDLLLYELVQHKVVNAAQAAKIKKLETNEYQRSVNQKLLGMNQMCSQLEVISRQRKSDLKQLQEAIQAKYDIDLSKVTYDDETGRIIEPPPDLAKDQPAA